MKRLISVLLILVLLFSGTGCNKKVDDEMTTVIPDINEPEKQTEQKEDLTEKPNEQTKAPADKADETDNNQIVINGSVSTSCGVTTPDEQLTEQKTLGVFPDSLTDADRQTLNNIAKSKKPIVTISKNPDEHSGCRFYYQAKAKELINLLASFKYTESICQCAADNVVYIGENLEFTFWLKKNPDGEYESVEHGGTSYQLTIEQGKKIAQLVETIFDEKNYKSIKGKENTVEFIERKGNSFVWYSFKNADADRLIYLTHNIEKTEPIMTEDIDCRFINTLSMRFALNCEKPYITGSNNSAYLNKKQLKEIKSILERNCIDENIKDDPDATMPVYIEDLKQNKKYTFTNEVSPFLINYIIFYSYLDRNVSCTCKEEYSIYSYFHIYMQKNKEIVKEKYSIGFVDGIAHMTQHGEYHLVLSKKDSEYIKEIIDKYCIEQNIVNKNPPA